MVRTHRISCKSVESPICQHETAESCAAQLTSPYFHCKCCDLMSLTKHKINDASPHNCSSNESQSSQPMSTEWNAWKSLIRAVMKQDQDISVKGVRCPPCFSKPHDRTVYRLTNSLTSATRTLSDHWRQFFYKYMFSVFRLKRNFEMFANWFEHFNIKRTELFFPVQIAEIISIVVNWMLDW